MRFRLLLFTFLALAFSPPTFNATALGQSLARTYTLNAANQNACIGTSGLPTIGVDLMGTASLTLQPQVSVNGSTPKPSSLTSTVAGSAPQATIVTSGSTSASYVAPAGGFDTFCLNVSAYSSGSLTVKLNPSPSMNAALLGSGGGTVALSGDFLLLPSPVNGSSPAGQRAGGPFPTSSATSIGPGELEALRVRIPQNKTVTSFYSGVSAISPGASAYFGLYSTAGVLLYGFKVDASAFSLTPVAIPGGPITIPAGEYIWASGTDEGYSNQQATITNVALTSNVVSITANNTYFAGQILYLTGVTTATFLEGQKLTVAAGPTPTGFTAPFTHANYVSAADTGTSIITTGTVLMDGYQFDSNYANVFGFRVKELISGGALPATISNALIPTTAAVRSTSVTSNVLTVWADNTVSGLPASFVPGATVTFGTLVSSWLSGQTVTILTNDYRSFTASFTHANYGAAQESAVHAVALASTVDAVTNIAISGGIATITAANALVAGECVELQGLTTVSALNTAASQVVSANGTSFTLQAFLPDQASAAETGIAMPSYAGNNNYLYSSPSLLLF
jgi:hypothetical protein